MPNLMRVRTVFEYGTGAPGLMTHYLGNDGGEYNDADAQVAVDRVMNALIAIEHLWPAGFFWQVTSDVDVLKDTDGEVLQQLAATARNGAGVAGGGLGPLPVGVLLKSTTNAFVSGRRLTGRTYFVPIAAESTNFAVPSAATRAVVDTFGTAMLDSGLTLVSPFCWSRPRPATAVGPGRPAGPARLARIGSSARITGYTTSGKYAVLTSRRD